jgi:DNA-binding LacI/PurR family transcriptional regulator
MGMLAATTLLSKIANQQQPATLHITPELIVRESTGPAALLPTEAQRRTRKRT